jgi:glycosyltransferase involved in cell wall biosynthesis
VWELFANIILPQKSIDFLTNLRCSLANGHTIKKSLGLWWQIHPISLWSPDIIHIETSYLAHYILDGLLSLNYPVVVSLRGADVDEKPLHSERWRAWYPSVNKIPNLHFHCVSQYIQTKAVYWGVDLEKTTVIYQSLDPKDFLEASTVKAETKQQDLVIVARLSPEKGVDLAIKAVAFLINRKTDIKLHIIGDGPLRSELDNLVKELNLPSESVVFHGEKSNDWVKAFLMENQKSCVYLQPSRLEAFGQAILEAMFAGMPVVAASVGGIPELIESEKTGLLHEPENVADLTDQVRRLLEDSSLRECLSNHASRTVFNRFNESVETQFFLGLFQDIIIQTRAMKR